MNFRSFNANRPHTSLQVFGLALLASLLAGSAWAAPTLTLGTASGQAGTTVNLPIVFDPTTASVADIQFNVALPAGLSTGAVTAGAILTSAGKNFGQSLIGNTWTFIIYGVNLTTISSGTLMTLQLTINPGTALGATSLPASGVVYSDPNGAGITAGTTTAGTVTVVPPAPVISSALTASATVGTAFSYSISASNSPTSFNAIGLPAGLSINTATGLISGTPTTGGTAGINISASNAGGTGSATLALTINAALPPAPVITGAATATGQQGVPFTYVITASNSPTSFNATGLPAGLFVNTVNGLISGTPTTSGSFSVALSATNSGGTGTKTLTLTINPPTPVISSALTASATVGTAFSYTITASNSPTSFNATGLPAGLSVNTANGLISGTPTTAGSSNIMISANNSVGNGSATLVLTVNPQAVSTPPTLTGGSVSGQSGTTVSLPITFNPGSASVADIQFNLTLPASLSTGTVTVGAILTSASKSLSANRVGNTWTFVVFGMNQTTIGAGTLLTAQMTIAAGTAAQTLNLPISGVIYSDANGNAITAGASAAASVTVTAPPPQSPVITSALSASGTVGTAFSYNISASNSPTSFNASGLPAGLSVNTTNGLISGTPTTAGSFSATISATNSSGTGSATLVLTINSAAPPRPVITSASSASGTVGTAFSYQITASNSPTNFNATGLPAGLSINTANGSISGTPTAAGSSNVTISVTNGGGTGSATLALTINTANITAPTLAGGTASGPAGTTVNLPINFNPGTASAAGIQFSLTLPAGLSTGSITAGLIVTSAGKSVSANLTGNTWTFIVFGMNQNTINNGTLLTLQLMIAPGTAAGTLNMPISGAVYTDPNGAVITAGANTAGTITVTPPSASQDLIPPTVSILSPASGANVRSPVYISLAASDNVAVTRLELWADGVLVQSEILMPPVPALNMPLSYNATLGIHSIQAKAYDAAGNVSTSGNPITVNVTRRKHRVSLRRLDPTGFVTADSETDGAGDARALVLSHQSLNSQSLVFDPDIKEAKIINLAGRTLIQQTRLGGPIVMSLQETSDQRLSMESGLMLIQMKDDLGEVSVKAIVAVK